MLQKNLYNKCCRKSCVANVAEKSVQQIKTQIVYLKTFFGKIVQFMT